MRFDLSCHIELSGLDRFQEGIFSLNKVFKKFLHSKWIKLYSVTLRGHIGAAKLSGAKISGTKVCLIGMYLKTYPPSFPLWCLNLWASFHLNTAVFPVHDCSLNRLKVYIWEKKIDSEKACTFLLDGTQIGEIAVYWNRYFISILKFHKPPSSKSDRIHFLWCQHKILCFVFGMCSPLTKKRARTPHLCISLMKESAAFEFLTGCVGTPQ